MALSNEEITKLFKIRATLMEMLRDRGYLVAEFEVNMTMAEFCDTFGKALQREDFVINKAKRNDSSDQILVFFPEEPTISKDVIQVCAARMNSLNVRRAIIVVQNSITKFAKKLVDVNLKSLHLEFFKEAELLISVVKHVLVPEHEVLTNEQKQLLLERYLLKESQLPHIQVNDSVARYYGLTHGQVVRIIRASEAAGRYVTYRICA